MPRVTNKLQIIGNESIFIKLKSEIQAFEPKEHFANS